MTHRPAENAPPTVHGLHHAAYRCRDAEETRRFYEDVLGFPLTQALEIEGHPLTGEPVRYLHIFFDIGGHGATGPSYIAFFEVPADASGGHAFAFKRQWGMDLHFAMSVADRAALAGWKARLEAQGLKVEGPHDHGICSSIYFHDPNGYRLEFTAQDSRQDAEFAEGARAAHGNLADWTARRSAAQSAG